MPLTPFALPGACVAPVAFSLMSVVKKRAEWPGMAVDSVRDSTAVAQPLPDLMTPRSSINGDAHEFACSDVLYLLARTSHSDYGNHPNETIDLNLKPLCYAGISCHGERHLLLTQSPGRSAVFDWQRRGHRLQWYQ